MARKRKTSLHAPTEPVAPPRSREKILEGGYWLTVVPAYGRDYKSADAAAKDWLGGKDFRIMDISSPWDGSYTSVRDHEGKPGVTIKIRYDRLAEFVLVTDGKVVENEEEDE